MKYLKQIFENKISDEDLINIFQEVSDEGYTVKIVEEKSKTLLSTVNLQIVEIYCDYDPKGYYLEELDQNEEPDEDEDDDDEEDDEGDYEEEPEDEDDGGEYEENEDDEEVNELFGASSKFKKIMDEMSIGVIKHDNPIDYSKIIDLLETAIDRVKDTNPVVRIQFFTRITGWLVDRTYKELPETINKANHCSGIQIIISTLTKTNFITPVKKEIGIFKRFKNFIDKNRVSLNEKKEESDEDFTIRFMEEIAELSFILEDEGHEFEIKINKSSLDVKLKLKGPGTPTQDFATSDGRMKEVERKFNYVCSQYPEFDEFTNRITDICDKNNIVYYIDCYFGFSNEQETYIFRFLNRDGPRIDYPKSKIHVVDSRILLKESIEHLKERGVDSNRTKYIHDEQTGDTFFFLYNLSGQMVGYQKYNINYPKNVDPRADPKLNRYFSWVGEEGRGNKIAVWGLETYQQDSKYIFITEGIFDCIKLHNAGEPAIATLCNHPSDSMKNWISTLPQKKIVIYDNDSAGRRLRSVGDYSFHVPGKNKDLGDLTQEEANRFIQKIKAKIGII